MLNKSKYCLLFLFLAGIVLAGINHSTTSKSSYDWHVSFKKRYPISNKADYNKQHNVFTVIKNTAQDHNLNDKDVKNILVYLSKHLNAKEISCLNNEPCRNAISIKYIFKQFLKHKSKSQKPALKWCKLMLWGILKNRSHWKCPDKLLQKQMVKSFSNNIKILESLIVNNVTNAVGKEYDKYSKKQLSYFMDTIVHHYNILLIDRNCPFLKSKVSDDTWDAVAIKIKDKGADLKDHYDFVMKRSIMRNNGQVNYKALIRNYYQALESAILSVIAEPDIEKWDDNVLGNRIGISLSTCNEMQYWPVDIWLNTYTSYSEIDKCYYNGNRKATIKEIQSYVKSMRDRTNKPVYKEIQEKAAKAIENIQSAN